MNVMFAGILGGGEIILVLAVVLIMFGAKKLPELAKGLGTGIREFKKATREVTGETQNVAEDNSTGKLLKNAQLDSVQTVSQSANNQTANNQKT